MPDTPTTSRLARYRVYTDPATGVHMMELPDGRRVFASMINEDDLRLDAALDALERLAAEQDQHASQSPNTSPQRAPQQNLARKA